VATGALGIGINIEGIIYVVHIDRPYGLTSFVQQSRQGGRNSEVSDSIIIAQVQGSQGRKRKGIMSEYSVEQVDEEDMTEFMQVRMYRRRVLSRHLDGESDGVDCRSTDSVFCDWCKTSNHSAYFRKAALPCMEARLAYNPHLASIFSLVVECLAGLPYIAFFNFYS
jgi:superfamily II DNA helicase RecQ